jgi:ketosteroid isomerase-like protein
MALRKRAFLAGLLLCFAFGAGPARAQDTPTPQTALATVQAIANALLANDADKLGPLLAPDWTVISTHGGMADRDDFLAAIRSGQFTRTSMEISEPRIKLYGDLAVVTVHVSTSGHLGGKPFNVQERSTDVLQWQTGGGWKSVLTQESDIRK